MTIDAVCIGQYLNLNLKLNLNWKTQLQLHSQLQQQMLSFFYSSWEADPAEEVVVAAEEGLL